MSVTRKYFCEHILLEACCDNVNSAAAVLSSARSVVGQRGSSIVVAEYISRMMIMLCWSALICHNVMFPSSYPPWPLYKPLNGWIVALHWPEGDRGPSHSGCIISAGLPTSSVSSNIPTYYYFAEQHHRRSYINLYPGSKKTSFANFPRSPGTMISCSVLRRLRGCLLAADGPSRGCVL